MDLCYIYNSHVWSMIQATTPGANITWLYKIFCVISGSSRVRWRGMASKRMDQYLQGFRIQPFYGWGWPGLVRPCRPLFFLWVKRFLASPGKCTFTQADVNENEHADNMSWNAFYYRILWHLWIWLIWKLNSNPSSFWWTANSPSETTQESNLSRWVGPTIWFSVC